MTNEELTKQLEARIDVLSFAFQALINQMTYSEASQVKSKIASLAEQATYLGESENITDPYRLEIRSFCAQLLG